MAQFRQLRRKAHRRIPRETMLGEKTPKLSFLAFLEAMPAELSLPPRAKDQSR